MKKIILAISVVALLISCKETKIASAKKDSSKTEQKTVDNSISSIYDFNYQSPKGEVIYMKEFANKVILIVNTATQCGLTPQFEGLEKLHTNYAKKGLVVLGFPCNQFGEQEPVSNEEMVAICKENHGVTFELTKKIEVNGINATPLYSYLKAKQKLNDNNDIRWNFEKFLVNRKGEVVKRFSPQTTPAEITAEIEGLL